MERNFALLIVFFIVIVALLWTFTRARRILESWAAENGYHIISSELRWLRRGPFFWTTSKNQVVYHVTVRIPEGTVKNGWVRCGSWWWGVFQNRAEARWEG